MIKRGIYMIFFVVSWGGSALAMAEDIVESQGTRVIGDSDMPKALYIVPWKKPALPVLSNRPATPFMIDAFVSINREALAFKIKQHDLLQGDGLVIDER